MSSNSTLEAKEVITCDSVTGTFSLDSIPEIDTQSPDLKEALEQINNTLVQRCSLDSTNTFLDRIVGSVDGLQQFLSQTSASDELVSRLEQLNTTLSTTPKFSFVETLGGALFSVLAAFVFNFLYWKMKEKKEKLQAGIIEAKVALEEFEVNASDYWSYDYSPRAIKSSSIQEAKIKANHFILLSTFNKKIKPLIGNSEADKVFKTKITKEIESLFDKATGGDFESSSRKASRKTVSDIIRRCARLKTQLSSLGA
jgi:hypothetical protein